MFGYRACWADGWKAGSLHANRMPWELSELLPCVDDVGALAEEALEGGAVLIHSTAPPDEVERIQEALGTKETDEALESAFGDIAARLVEKGVRTLVVAGGETSGAITRKLGLRRLRFGTEIDPGVPWTQHLGEPLINVAFKAGNAGAEDFFLKALEDADS